MGHRPRWPTRCSSRRGRRCHSSASRATRSLCRTVTSLTGGKCWSSRVMPTGTWVSSATASSRPATTSFPTSRPPSACTRTRAPTRSAPTSTRSSERSGSSPRLALPSHGEPIEDPIGRAYEILEHHRRRLARTVEALEAEPQTAYRLSFQLFPADLDPPQRRFAVAETLSHVERLVQEGQARHQGSDGSVTYTAA